MATSTSAKPAALSTAVLRDLHAFWLKDVVTFPNEPLPDAVTKRWFSGGDAVDIECMQRFGDAVEQAAKMDKDSLIEAFVETPNDAVALAVLLDQMPRNIYRGHDAKKAYAITDPIARDVSKHFLRKYDKQERNIWGNINQFIFLYLPLLHSESTADHQLMQRKQKELIASSTGKEDLASLEQYYDFEMHHAKVIERFGRYPSRNECLSRESTQQEIEFLANGPGW